MKALKYILVAFTLVALHTTISAQTIEDSQEVTAKAVVISPIMITESTVMDFGQLYSFAESYSVTLLPDATSDRRTSTNASVPAISNGTVKLAVLDVEGPASSSFAITCPTTAIDLVAQDGDASMQLSQIKAYTLNGSEINDNVSLGESGQYKFRVGATLTLAAGQKVGLYEGSFNVTVSHE